MQSRFHEFYYNPGRFGGKNRPGYPMPMTLVRKFASVSSARAPLSSMHKRCKDQPDTVFTLGVLVDVVAFCYRPGDIFIVAMNTPTQFCVGHRDVVSVVFYLSDAVLPPLYLKSCVIHCYLLLGVVYTRHGIRWHTNEILIFLLLWFRDGERQPHRPKD